MARTRLPDSARVPIGLKVSEADAARIDQVLARPEFTGWTRSEWCREIIRSALRYYVGDAPEPDPGPPARVTRPVPVTRAPSGQVPGSCCGRTRPGYPARRQRARACGARATGSA